MVSLLINNTLPFKYIWLLDKGTFKSMRCSIAMEMLRILGWIMCLASTDFRIYYAPKNRFGVSDFLTFIPLLELF